MNTVKNRLLKISSIILLIDFILLIIFKDSGFISNLLVILLALFAIIFTFTLFKKFSIKEYKDNFSKNHEEFGNKTLLIKMNHHLFCNSGFEDVSSFEDKLDEVLSEVKSAGVDGNEIGDDKILIFVACESPESILEKIKTFLLENNLSGSEITLNYGDIENESTYLI